MSKNPAVQLCHDIEKQGKPEVQRAGEVEVARVGEGKGEEERVGAIAVLFLK